jgi:hypothetical protein
MFSTTCHVKFHDVIKEELKIKDLNSGFLVLYQSIFSLAQHFIQVIFFIYEIFSVSQVLINSINNSANKIYFYSFISVTRFLA